MVYFGCILLALIVIVLLNYFFAVSVFGFSLLYIIMAVAVSTFAVLLIDAITAFVIRWLIPEKFFSVEKTYFMGRRYECIFYEKIGIKLWKDKIPELGKFTDFRKNKIADPTNNEYVKRYIVEANYGVMIHFAGVMCGFLIIFIYPLKYFLNFGIPIAVINAIYNMLSLFILRYNLPKLHKLYRINVKREERLKLKTVES